MYPHYLLTEVTKKIKRFYRGFYHAGNEELDSLSRKESGKKERSCREIVHYVLY